MNVVVQEILVLTRVKYIASSKRITADKNVVFSNIKIQMISNMPVFFEKIEFSYKLLNRSTHDNK